LFGVDAILQGPTLWPLEVNPRYTASVEVLERARGWLAMSLHVEACQHARLPAAAPHSSTLPRSCGKAILYARRNVALGGRFEELVAQWNQAADWPTLTDIPPPGSVIGARRPICSIHAKGVDLETVADQLRALAAELEANLYHERG
ncbi:MAG: hypothetical protein GTO03_14965, partial [Planctomycetales bacterium]|nr:hypothetical protein [Planctomycetales bacterium]